MAAFLRKNFARGSLSLLLTDVAVQMRLNVGHGLPTEAGFFRAVIWNMSAFSNPADDPDTEIVTASYSGVPNVYNIQRAQEGTLQVGHPVNSEVAIHYTSGMSEDDLDWLGSKQIDEGDVGDDKVPVVSGNKLVYKKLLQYDSELATLLVNV